MRSFLGDQGYCLWFLVLLCAPIHNLISLHPYSRSTGLVAGVWTTFDLVRPFKAQGSNATTPFHRIVRPSDAPGDGKGAKFGWSVANIGDIDGNGFDDIAVGAIGETDGQNTPNIGAVYIFRMLADGTYNKTYTRLSGDDYPKLANVEEGNQFGYSLACLGSVNNNGITQLAVSAPGVYLSSVYILFINEHGEVMKNTLIRGKYEAPSSNSSFPTNSTLHNTTSLFNQSYTINGPPITYGSRFGSALANLGVLDPNYYTVLAASSLTVTGLNVVYLLYLNQTGYVKKYLTLTPDMAEIKSVYSNFGSSIVILPKIHHTDPHFTVAIGASRLYEAGSINLNAGTAFLFYITGDGRVNHTRIISETSSPGIQLPFTSGEGFGTAITTIGDINYDQYAQHVTPTRPFIRRPNWKELPSIPDLVVGCPQSESSGGTGRLFFIFLNLHGEIAGYTRIPAFTDDVTNISLHSFEEFGHSLAPYQDVDKNLIKEIVVGAPSRTNEAGIHTGAFYIIFPRRRRDHPVPFDYLRYYLWISLPPGIFMLLCCFGTCYFFWYYRRKPDEVEIFIKKSGLVVDPSKPRKKYLKQNVVYIDEYVT